MDLTSVDGIWEGITPCQNHPEGWDDDCDGCDAEATARNVVIEQLQTEMKTRVMGLNKVGVTFPTMAMDHIRLELLIDMVFQGRAAYQFEGEAGRRGIAMVKAMQADAVKGPEKRLHVIKGFDPQ